MSEKGPARFNRLSSTAITGLSEYPLSDLRYHQSIAAVRKMRKWSDILRHDATLIMGVLNVTPDSFSDGGRFLGADAAVEHAKRMAREGADIIDVGGQSTRPGAKPLAAEDELGRIKPVIQRLVAELDVPISIDTFQPDVAEECLRLGATIINDVSGLRDPRMMAVAARYEAPVVLMHMLGTPLTMQEEISYQDVVEDLKTFFRERTREATEAGVRQVMIDPGIGFGKTAAHNLRILDRLGEFKDLGYPVLVGASRKSFIGEITGLPVENRLEGTIAATVIAAGNGADAVRVHDVAACKQALRITDAVRQSRQ